MLQDLNWVGALAGQFRCLLHWVLRSGLLGYLWVSKGLLLLTLLILLQRLENVKWAWLHVCCRWALRGLLLNLVECSEWSILRNATALHEIAMVVLQVAPLVVRLKNLLVSRMMELGSFRADLENWNEDLLEVLVFRNGRAEVAEVL